jgi:hypothetical protein
VSKTYVIRAIAFANGTHCPHADQWLESFDHEAFNGRGHGEFTSDIADAMHFATSAEAFQFWGKQSSKRPRRPDGKPNKPLTALTVVIEEA